MDYLEPLNTYFRENPDFNEADCLDEIRMLANRQQMIEQICRGKETPDTLLDLLELQGFDALDYCQVTAANIETVLNHQLPISSLAHD